MKKKLNQLRTSSTIPLDKGNQAYQHLRQTILKKGFLQRSHLYYTAYFVVVVLLFSFSVYQLYISEHLGLVLLWAVLFGFLSVQLSGFIHDAGHRSIFKSTKLNDIFGEAFSFLVAIHYRYWRNKHNRHHAHPNEEEEDPDVQLPVLSFTKERYASKRGLTKFLRNYQVFLYFPIGTLVFASLRIESIKYFVKNFHWKLLPETLLFIVSFCLWFIGPFVFFDPLKAVMISIIVNVVTGFYLFSIFAPNHKGMPYFGKGTKISFLEQQVVTSRNIHGNWLVDIIYLGLNYQIEHHLFPNCPRNKLHLIAPYVRSTCESLNLPYTTVSIFAQNKILLSELHTIASGTQIPLVTNTAH